MEHFNFTREKKYIIIIWTIRNVLRKKYDDYMELNRRRYGQKIKNLNRTIYLFIYYLSLIRSICLLVEIDFIP